MMKFLLVLVAVFGLAYCDTTCTAPSPNLLDEFKKFVDLLPLDKLGQVVLNYSANDDQVQQVLVYLESKDFANVVEIFESQKEIIDIYAFFCTNGIDIYKYLNTLHDLLGIPHVTPAPSRNISPSSRTFRQFLDDMEKLIPLEKMKALFKQEQTTSTVWKSFVDRASSKEFRAMVDKMIALPEVKKFVANLEKLGADINKFEKFFRDLLGWSTD